MATMNVTYVVERGSLRDVPIDIRILATTRLTDALIRSNAWVRSGSGFRFDNPQAVVAWDDPVAQRVQQVIDEKVMPSVAGHGGWVELLAVDGETAVIQFGGGCQGCGMSQVTLKDGIERIILDEIPEIKKVVDDTDHASGENPYYSS